MRGGGGGGQTSAQLKCVCMGRNLFGRSLTLDKIIGGQVGGGGGACAP